jgi:P4 family phage/plasmid primase-like protien
MNNSQSLEQLLQQCVVKKGDNKPITHTEFGKFSKRSFHIPLDVYDSFLKLFYKDVIKAKKNHNLIERQLINKGSEESGVILIDIDFKFAPENCKRYYTREHLDEFVQFYLHALEELCEMDEDVHFQVVIMEKPNPRTEVKDTGNIVKDGIHMLINLAHNRESQMWLRAKVIQQMDEHWSHFPIINSDGWMDVLDDSIPSGTNGWLPPNCKKPDDVNPYDVTYIKDVYYDTDESKWVISNILTKENKDSIMNQHYKILFPRYRDRQTLLVRTSILPQLQQYKQPVQTRKDATKSPMFATEEHILTTHMILSIKCKEDLDACVALFDESMGIKEFEMRESRDYAMILPSSYYGPGSYNKWIKVGFVLNNISSNLLIAWIQFSAQSSSFMYSSIPEILSIWGTLRNKREMGGLTKRSLIYWARQENPTEFLKVQQGSLDYYIDLTIDSTSLKDAVNPNKKSGTGSTDCDLANVLYVAKKNEYVSAGIRENVWYMFSDHKWSRDDSGTSLRKFISTGLKQIYYDKAMRVWELAMLHEVDSEEYKLLTLRANKVNEIAQRLGSSSDKDKIMKEARELFYDKQFLSKLDKNLNLFCCKNGVIDFVSKIFRKGTPEDYLSIGSEINYNESEGTDAEKETRTEIREYFRTLFPIEDLEAYAWNHIASLLTGLHDKRQFLHYWTGNGRNGKSMLTILLRKIMGEYACDLDASFYTCERQKRGQSTPELVAIIGKRLAVTAEVEEGEKMFAAPMKQITSASDVISCRALYGQLMEFISQANPVIMANHYLQIHSRDDGTWRRVRVLPFLSIFTEKPVQNDPERKYQFKLMDNIIEKFDKWAPVFLTMLVEIAFKTDGMVEMCRTVEDYSKNYQNEQDYIMGFINGFITKTDNPNDVIRQSEIVERFNNWYRDSFSGKKVNKTKDLLEKMDNVFGKRQFLNNNKTTTVWKGVLIGQKDAPSGTPVEIDCDLEPDELIKEV